MDQTHANDSGPVISRRTHGVLHRRDYNDNNDTPRIRRRLVNAHWTHIIIVTGRACLLFQLPRQYRW